MLDSGLMLFSKFPFVPVTIPGGSDECVKPSGDKCLVAFHQYEAQEDEDSFAAKGIGFVRVMNPTTEGETNVFFTHMQASGTELQLPNGCADITPEACTIAARAKQIEEAVDFVDTWSSRWDTTRDTLLMGDLNVRHQNEDGSPTGEYTKRISPLANGVGFDEIGLRDVWAETSPLDPVSSKWPSPNNKLDYILHRPPYVKGDPGGGFCATQHQTLERHFIYSEQSGNASIVIDASDHYPYAAVIGRPGPHCSPALALQDPPDGLLPLTITHPGSYQWLHFTKGGTYGFGVASPVAMELTAYPENDLSTPRAPFLGGGVIPGGGHASEKVVFTPATGFYLRVRVADPASPHWTGNYGLLIDKHDGTSPAEAIQLDPWRPYTGDQMTVGVQNPVGRVWFWVKTDTLDSAQQQRFTFETYAPYPTPQAPPAPDRQVRVRRRPAAGRPRRHRRLHGGERDAPVADPGRPEPGVAHPRAGDLYYLTVEKEINRLFPSGPFTLQWSTNLFYTDLIRLRRRRRGRRDERRRPRGDRRRRRAWAHGDLRPDGRGRRRPVLPRPAPEHQGRDESRLPRLQQRHQQRPRRRLPRRPDRMRRLRLAHHRADDLDPVPNHYGVDLDPVVREIDPHLVNAADDDGEWVIWWKAYKRIDQ